MPVQLPSLGSDVPDTVQRALKSLTAAVNQLESQLPRRGEQGGDLVGELQSLRAQLMETASRVDDLTRRIRALGG